jgi:hypothetical protein
VIDADILVTFLNRSHTEEREAELDKHLVTDKMCRSVMENFGRNINSLLLDAAELLSERFDTRSEATVFRQGSSGRSELTTKRMQAKAQKTRLIFAKEQTELQKKKPCLKQNQTFLSNKKK